MLINLNNLNIYIKNMVAVFKLFAKVYPLVKIFTPLSLRRCAGIAQPYTYLCVCFGNLLTRSKWNINSSC